MKRLIVFLFVIFGASCGFAQTITNVVVSATTSSTATIQWTTNTSANSIILYGTSATLNSSTSIDPASVTSHTEIVSNLQVGTLYYFAVKSGSTTSSTYNFSLCGNSIVSAFGSTNNYYQYGAYTFTWVPPTGSSVTPTSCGVPIALTATGSLSSTGSFNTSIPDSSMVLPGPGQWQVRVQDAANVAPVTITTGITYNGIDLTSAFASGITSAGLSNSMITGFGSTSPSLSVGPVLNQVNYPNTLASFVGTSGSNGYVQIVAQDLNPQGSSTFVMGGSNMTNTTHYGDIQYNGPGTNRTYVNTFFPNANAMGEYSTDAELDYGVGFVSGGGAMNWYVNQYTSQIMALSNTGNTAPNLTLENQLPIIGAPLTLTSATQQTTISTTATGYALTCSGTFGSLPNNETITGTFSASYAAGWAVTTAGTTYSNNSGTFILSAASISAITFSNAYCLAETMPSGATVSSGNTTTTLAGTITGGQSAVIYPGGDYAAIPAVTVSGFTTCTANNGSFPVLASTATGIAVTNAGGSTCSTGSPVIQSTAAVNSTTLTFSTNYGTGAGTQGIDKWTAQDVMGVPGTNPTSTLTFAHTGTTGVSSASFPALKVAAARIGTFTCTGGGTIVVTNSNAVATSMITFSLNTLGGTITTSPAMSVPGNGTQFSMFCGATDTSIYNYEIWN